MKSKANKLSSAVKALGATTVLGSLLVAGGCGSEPAGAGAVITQSNTIPAASTTQSTSNPSAIVVSQVVQAATTSGATAITIPAGTTITPPTGSSFAAANPPAISVTTFSANSSLPAPADATFVLDSSAGAVDVQIGDIVHGVTFSQPVTISIPYSGTVAGCNVQVNKNDGTGYHSVPNAVCSGGVATVQVSDLCTFVLNPHWIKATATGGTTGSTGGTSSNGF